MTVRQRWKRTSISNKLLVIVGAAAVVVAFLSFGSAVTQIFLTWQSGKESSDRTDRILANLNWLAGSMNGALREAERSRVESEERSSQSLAASINIARGEQRAWVGVSQMGLKDSPARVGIPLSATVVTINSGRTPAAKVRSPIAAAYMKAGTKLVHPKFRVVGLPSAGVMLPNIPQIANTIPIEGINGRTIGILSTKNMDEIKAGKWDLYVYGSITYDDVFGRHHFTHFCAFLNPETLSIFRACDTYNDAN